MSSSIRPSSKDAIIEAAFTIFSRNPGASLAEVAEQAGVGRATLHRHFASRDDLIHALALIALAEMDAAAESACNQAPTYADAFQRMFAALIPLGDRHGFLSREPVEHDPEVAAEIKRQMNLSRDMVEEAKQDGLFDSAIPTDWIAQAFDYLIYAAWDSIRAGEVTQRQAADLAWRTFINGLGKAAP